MAVRDVREHGLNPRVTRSLVEVTQLLFIIFPRVPQHSLWVFADRTYHLGLSSFAQHHFLNVRARAERSRIALAVGQVFLHTIAALGVLHHSESQPCDLLRGHSDSFHCFNDRTERRQQPITEQ